MTKMAAIMKEEIKEEGDFIVNEKEKNVHLTADGVKKVESFLISRIWQTRRISDST